MIGQDIRYAVRLLLRRPGFTLVATATLALAIGALTAIVSITYTVLLKPLPLREPARLVQIWENNPAKGWLQNIVAPANLVDWRERTRTLEGIAAYHGDNEKGGSYTATHSTFTLTGLGEPEPIRGLGVTANIFDVIGVPTELGRTFAPDDDQPGRRAIVISDGLWRRRFGARRDIIGQQIEIDGRPRDIIGVMPAGFAFPSTDTDIWAGLGLDRATMLSLRRPHMLRAIARLKPGVTVDQARTDLQSIARQLSREYPDINATMGADLGSLQEWVVGPSRRKLLLFLGAAAFVLLIACTNVASLLTVLGLARSRELALRTALGAGRGRLIRQLLTESLVLAAIGGALGLVLTIWAVRLFVALSPGDVPRIDEIRVDRMMLLVAGSVALAATMLFGLMPAWQAVRPELTGALREGGRGSSAGPRPHRVRRALVAAEVALAVVLVACSGLLIRSFVRLQQVDPGVTRERVVTFKISLPQARYGKEPQQLAFVERLLPAIGALPGVRSVGTTSQLPLTGTGWTGDSTIEGRPLDDFIPGVGHKEVSPSYFTTVGLRLLRGRGFLDSDRHTTTPVVVVNEALARRHFGNEDPIGRRLTFSKPSIPGPWHTIVGVVQDERQTGLEGAIEPSIYRSMWQDPALTQHVVIRTDAAAAALMPAVRRAIGGIDGGLAIERVRTLEDVIAATLSPERFAMLLMSAFGGLALVLATIGIYGVVSFSVTQRTPEIGVRLALGASPRDVRRLVVRDALRPVVMGVAIGLAVAAVATRLLAHALFEVSPIDPATFAGVVALLLMVALAASHVPARRAMRVEPIEALRLD